MQLLGKEDVNVALQFAKIYLRIYSFCIIIVPYKLQWLTQCEVQGSYICGHTSPLISLRV